MAVVECGLCGWTDEVDEDLPDPQLEWTAMKIYSEHVLENHPAQAPTDTVVAAFIHGTIKPEENGTPFHLRRD
jgi:hypothetical protein